jgi:hypothetical protein
MSLYPHPALVYPVEFALLVSGGLVVLDLGGLFGGGGSLRFMLSLSGGCGGFFGFVLSLARSFVSFAVFAPAVVAFGDVAGTGEHDFYEKCCDEAN